MYKFVLYEQGKFQAANSYTFVLRSDKCPPPQLLHWAKMYILPASV
jgi:hypothetical protein